MHIHECITYTHACTYIHTYIHTAYIHTEICCIHTFIHTEICCLGLEMGELPESLIQIILRKCALEDIGRASCVDFRWFHAASDETLWRDLCSKDFGLDSPSDHLGSPCSSFKVNHKIISIFGLFLFVYIQETMVLGMLALNSCFCFLFVLLVVSNHDVLTPTDVCSLLNSRSPLNLGPDKPLYSFMCAVTVFF